MLSKNHYIEDKLINMNDYIFYDNNISFEDIIKDLFKVFSDTERAKFISKEHKLKTNYSDVPLNEKINLLLINHNINNEASRYTKIFNNNFKENDKYIFINREELFKIINELNKYFILKNQEIECYKRILYHVINQLFNLYNILDKQIIDINRSGKNTRKFFDDLCLLYSSLSSSSSSSSNSSSSGIKLTAD